MSDVAARSFRLRWGEPRRLLRGLVAGFAIQVAAAACVADAHARRADREEGTTPARTVAETRTGIPVLMDLPLVGVLFGRRTVAR